MHNTTWKKLRGVEKMWKNLCENLRESCGKKCEKLWINKFSTKFAGVFHRFGVTVEKFYHGYTQDMTGVMSGFYTVSTGLTNTTIILG